MSENADQARREQAIRVGPGALDASSGDLEEERSLAATSPPLAIERSYARLEDELRRVLERDGAPLVDLVRAGAHGLAHAAHARGLIPASTVESIEGLAVMRALAADPARVTVEQAQQFVALTEDLLWLVRRASPPPDTDTAS